MQKFNLHFSIQVAGGKYREMLNILEAEQEVPLQKGCLSRSTFQSIRNLNELSYLEVWEDFRLLEKSMSSERYEYLLGAVMNLCHEWSVEIYEKIEIDQYQHKISQ
jgi:quinol monooxygenase YgiN